MKLIKRPHLAYLLFLLVPALWLYLGTNRNEAAQPETSMPGLLSFSVRVQQPAHVSILSGSDALLSNTITPGAFRHIQVAADANLLNNLTLTVSGIEAGDTIFMSDVFLFRGGKHHKVLFNMLSGKLLPEAPLHGLMAFSGGDVGVSLSLDSMVSRSASAIPLFYRLLPWLLLVVALVLLFVFAPSASYLAGIIGLTLILMATAYFAIPPPSASIELNTETATGSTELFFNNTPFFHPYKKTLNNDALAPVFASDFSKDKYFRIDFTDTATILQHLTVHLKTGLFNKALHLDKNGPEGIILNDLDYNGSSYLAAGADPYLATTTSQAETHIAVLLYLHQLAFFFVSLAFFVLLLLLWPLLKRFFAKPFNPLYLIFLCVPALYLLLIGKNDGMPTEDDTTHIYFSLQTSKNCEAFLCNGDDTLSLFQTTTGTYRYCHFEGALGEINALNLRFSHLMAGDSIRILSPNLYHKGVVTSLGLNASSDVASTNATPFVNGHDNGFVVNSSDAPVVCFLPHPHSIPTETGMPPNVYVLIIMGLILMAFWRLSPHALHVTTATAITCALLPFLYWVAADMQWQLTWRTSEPVKSMQFFYNNEPVFMPARKYDVNNETQSFTTQIALHETPFLRIDFADALHQPLEADLTLNTGLMRLHLSISSQNAHKILLNDIHFDGNRLAASGPDPYVVLSSGQWLKTLHTFIGWRQQAFVVLGLLVFLVLLWTLHRTKRTLPKDFALTAVFIIVLSSGYLLRLFNAPHIILPAEMRYATSFPAFTPDSLQQSLKQADNYLTDQVPGRGNLIRMNNYIEYKLFGELADNPRIHFGKEDWLFYMGDMCRENYENRNPLTTDELERMKEVLEARRDFLKAQGAKFYVVFPPMAYFVYEDKVGPRLWRYHPKSKVEQLNEYLDAHSDIALIDVQTPLREAAKKYPFDLYFRNNSHWNFYGAYVAYHTMIRYMQKDFPMLEPLPLKALGWKKYKAFEPDLWMHLALEKFFHTNELEPFSPAISEHIEPQLPVYEGYSAPAPPFCYENKAVDYPSMLLYGDSYAGYMLFYLSANFRRSVYLFTPLFYPSVMQQEKPDIVIQEMNDYAIYNLLYE